MQVKCAVVACGLVCLLGLGSGIACGPDLDRVKNLHRGAGTTVVAFGDSITAGYGVPPRAAYPAVLQDLIGVPVVNRGRNGDTTASALARLPADVLAARPWLVIVGLGGNDFLQQVPKSETERNLRRIVRRLTGAGAIVVLLGMNLGLFVDEYRDLYARVAREEGAYLVPQVLKGILDDPRYRQADFIHPNAAGHAKLAHRIAASLKPLLKRAVWPPVLLRYRRW